jgi:hypothetical protein
MCNPTSNDKALALALALAPRPSHRSLEEDPCQHAVGLKQDGANDLTHALRAGSTGSSHGSSQGWDLGCFFFVFASVKQLTATRGRARCPLLQTNGAESLPS